MRGRLVIENTEIDLTEEFSNQITYAIDDIRNLDSKSTNFTKTVIIPGTTGNNTAFGNIFQFTSSNFTIDDDPNIGYNFNAAKAADCFYEVDGLLVIKGVFRLLEIIYDNGRIEYEGQIVGELGGLVAKLGNKRLQDLDFSQYDHNFTVENIVGSWSENFTYNIVTSAVFTASTKKIKVPQLILSNLSAGDSITISGTTSNNGTFTITNIVFSRIVFDRYTEITVDETVVNETDASFTISYTKPFGSGYYYPLIDYGNVSTDKVNFQYTAFRPALFLYEYVDKIITGAGYTWESSFFETNFFKRLIIPNNDKGLYKRGVTEYIDASNNATQIINTGGGLNTDLVTFQDRTLTNFSVNGGGNTFTYTNPAPITIKATLNISGIFEKSNPAGVLKIILSAGDATAEYDFPAGNDEFSETLELTTDLANGDQVKVSTVSLQGVANINLEIFSAELIVQKDPPGKVELPIGETIFVNDTIPKGIFQKDFLTSVIKMFNLMIREDKLRTRHLIIEPYPDFFQLTNYEDWSDKINRSGAIRMKPMSELNARYYQMKYKQDNEFYAEAYRKKYNEGYGDRIYDTAYDFAKETETVELIFSSSALYGAAGTDKIYPAIYKKSGNEGFEDTIEHNIRIMQAKRITGVSSWDILDGSTVLTSLTEYGYAGHLDDPDAPNSDINFGVPKELFFDLATGNLSANLFNAYYSPYLAEITDKDSRLLTAEFRLTPLDIYNLDFSRLKYIDGALFRLQRVIDWNDKGDELVKCELLRVINLVY